MNSRNALRSAQALDGFRACLRALLPAPTTRHRASEERPDPGGRRV